MQVLESLRPEEANAIAAAADSKIGKNENSSITAMNNSEVDEMNA